jgi:hypothetical protein
MSRGRSARTKGAAAEREFFKLLNERLSPESMHFQRNILQSRIGGLDSEAHHPVAIEIKRQERVMIGKWLEQLREAAEFGQTRALAYRQNKDTWHVLIDMDVDEFCDFLARTYSEEYQLRGSVAGATEDLPSDTGQSGDEYPHWSEFDAD